MLELQRLAIHPDWQNKGYGKKLYQLFLAEFETRRYTKAELLVPEELLAAGQSRRSLEWVVRQKFANAKPRARTVGKDIRFCRLIL